MIKLGHEVYAFMVIVTHSFDNESLIKIDASELLIFLQKVSYESETFTLFKLSLILILSITSSKIDTYINVSILSVVVKRNFITVKVKS